MPLNHKIRTLEWGTFYITTSLSIFVVLSFLVAPINIKTVYIFLSGTQHYIT